MLPSPLPTSAAAPSLPVMGIVWQLFPRHYPASLQFLPALLVFPGGGSSSGLVPSPAHVQDWSRSSHLERSPLNHGSEQRSQPSVQACHENEPSNNVSRNATITFRDDSWIFFFMNKFLHRTQKLSPAHAAISAKASKGRNSSPVESMDPAPRIR